MTIYTGMKIYFENTFIGSSEDGQFLDYLLNSQGSTLEELIENSSISEIDQDGEETLIGALEDIPNRLYDHCIEMFKRKLNSLNEIQ